MQIKSYREFWSRFLYPKQILNKFFNLFVDALSIQAVFLKKSNSRAGLAEHIIDTDTLNRNRRFFGQTFADCAAKSADHRMFLNCDHFSGFFCCRNDQLLIKSYETQLNELKRMAGDKTKEIEQLTRKRDLLMEKHRDSLKLGLQRYNEAMAGQTTVLWKKHDFESFASYYSLVDVEFVASLDAEYDGLSPKQKFFLIMEHMDKSETEIQNALGVAEVTMRSIRSRIGKKHKA